LFLLNKNKYLQKALVFGVCAIAVHQPIRRTNWAQIPAGNDGLGCGGK
jgi:hypothetical protein